MRRLPLVIALAALPGSVLVPLAVAGPAAAADGPVRVTAVVRDAHGHLSFRHGRAADSAAGRRLVGRWRHDSGVVATAVDHRVQVQGTPDPLRSQQWGLSTLGASQLWNAGNATGQVVGVVDTGVDASHPDLAGVVLPGTDIVAGTGDGRVDPNGHGTHVSGIVAAVGDNGIGIAGLAQGAKILPVRVMASDGTGWDSDAAQGVVWAADHGATVINLSLGSPDRSSVMDSAVAYALGKGVPVVVAAGNDGLNGDPVEYPAADPGVIAVGAVDSTGVRPGWSSTGAHLAVAAPGVDIWSTVPTSGAVDADPSGYASWDGTSMATPFVSASVALLKAHLAGLSPATVRSTLMATADDLGAVGFDTLYGAGRVDPVAAEGLSVTSAPAPAPAPVTSPSPSPSPSPSAVPSPVASPVASPVTAIAPVLGGRISLSRSSLPYGSALTVSARALSDGVGTPGLPVRLERRVGTSWVLTRTGVSGDAGLLSWTLRPDQTMDFRVTGDGWASSVLHLVVTPAVTLAASATGAAGTVRPGGLRTVALQVRHSTGWVTFAYATTSSTGSYRLVRRFGAGTLLRAVAGGGISPTVRV